MKMKLFTPLKLKFEKPNWAKNTEFGLIDTILEAHPELFELLEADIVSDNKSNDFGRKDTPSVERIVRAAIYKELKGLDYRELEYHQVDSRICDQFLKIDGGRQYSFQMYQNYISRIKPESLQELLVSLNRVAIKEGLEDLEKLRTDSTVVETNIHYPTNNALVWDCMKESHRLLSKLDEEVKCIGYRDYLKGAKKTHFKINVTKKKQYCRSTKAMISVLALEQLLPLMEQVYSMTERKEVNGESVPNDEKLFSIYELIQVSL